jgi:hypothetical protein
MMTSEEYDQRARRPDYSLEEKQLFATLAIAAAIREQTEAFVTTGIRARQTSFAE